jgi:hypothetical protein
MTPCRAALRACLPLILLVGACSVLHSRRAPERLRVGEIVRMSDARVPAAEIVARIRTSGTVYRLTGSQLARLHDRGVPDGVMEQMQRTYLVAVGRNQFLADEGRWSLEYHQPPP